MDIVGLGPIDQRWNTGIEAEEAIVGRPGRGPVLERRSEHRLVSIGEYRADVLMVLEHVGLGLETFPGHGRRIVAEERIVRRSLTNHVLDLLSALLERL